jgi:hypothetical protein
MLQWFKNFGRFLWSLVKHWGNLVTGALPTVALLIWQKVTTHDAPNRAYWILAGVAFLFASFYSWLDQHHKLESFREIGGPQLWLGYDSRSNQPAMCIQNNGGGYAHNINLEIPGTRFICHKEAILADDRTAIRCNWKDIARVTHMDLIQNNAADLAVHVTCEDSNLRSFEYIFSPVDKGSGFWLSHKECVGIIKRPLPTAHKSH